MNAANSIKDISSSRKTSFTKNSFERYDVLGQIREKIKQEQKSVDQNTTRNDLEEKAAKIVYLKMLYNLDHRFKSEQKAKMRAAMEENELKRGTQKIMQDERGFGALRAMSDEQLRGLVTADDAGQLYGTYINNIVHAKQKAENEKQKTDQVSKRLFRHRDEMKQEKVQGDASKDDSSVAYSSGSRKPKGAAPKVK